MGKSLKAENKTGNEKEKTMYKTPEKARILKVRINKTTHQQLLDFKALLEGQVKSQAQEIFNPSAISLSYAIRVALYFGSKAKPTYTSTSAPADHVMISFEIRGFLSHWIANTVYETGLSQADIVRIALDAGLNHF